MDNTKMHAHDLDCDMTNFSQALGSLQPTMLSSPLSLQSMISISHQTRRNHLGNLTRLGAVAITFE